MIRVIMMMFMTPMIVAVIVNFMAVVMIVVMIGRMFMGGSKHITMLVFIGIHLWQGK